MKFKNTVKLETPQGCRFGGINGIYKISNPDGWLDYLPSTEVQRFRSLETMACVSFSAINTLEMQFKYLIKNKLIDDEDLKWLEDNGYMLDGEVNFSDRFIATLSETKKSGNYLSKVAETIKQFGLVPEVVWDYPRPDDDPDFKWNDYYREIPESVIELGKKFLERFDIQYEYVPQSDFSKALEFAPIQVIVYAWVLMNGKYQKDGTFNHATTLFDDYMVFDTYSPYVKQLAVDNLYTYGYQYTITNKINYTNMLLKENYLYLLVEGNEMKTGVVVNGKLLVDDWLNVQKIWIGRTKGDIKDKVVSVKLADWNSVDHYNLKMEKLT